ncbi:MAG: GxxExxY protein [Planctomycetes bacterium]|nr:GxxExxY protein [Planctomycetota bacterium]MBI3833967.1 GxxExxY protein [Planctomycetota bacterium]
MFDDPLTQQIIGLAMKVRGVLGPGFMESVYRRALLIELRKAGLHAEEEKQISVFYEGAPVGDFAADILVEDKVILELKAVEAIGKVHEVQTVDYLTATGLDIGLLINFGSDRLQFKRKFRQRNGARQDFQEGQGHSASHPDNPVHPVKL